MILRGQPSKPTSTRCPTKKEVTSLVSSMFDTFGFLHSFIIQANILQHNMENDGDWDKPIQTEIQLKWQQWMEDLRKSGARSFPIFVGNWVGEIEETTNSSKWRWVPTKGNPAYDATRNVFPSDLSSSRRCLLGPSFLLLPENHWPAHLTPRQTRENQNSNKFTLKLTKSSVETGH
ncbi:unnamed protein product [Allacma fusca]|uniref:Uncharacterized protein n=1 Tax=Allacma fusca TaxID=39272 RepID=A0A8J2PET2_9HEXA|nr:unnamed protein product [Allacma fusca]